MGESVGILPNNEIICVSNDVSQLDMYCMKLI